MADATPEKKIVVDEDWKSQVEAEREQLARERETPTAAAESPPPAEAAAPPASAMPPASFGMLISTLATEALAGLGQQPHPATGKPTVDLDQAKYFIDMLGILEEKTRGNLSSDESQTLSGLLHQLRLAFIEVQKQPRA